MTALDCLLEPFQGGGKWRVVAILSMVLTFPDAFSNVAVNTSLLVFMLLLLGVSVVLGRSLRPSERGADDLAGTLTFLSVLAFIGCYFIVLGVVMELLYFYMVSCVLVLKDYACRVASLLKTGEPLELGVVSARSSAYFFGMALILLKAYLYYDQSLVDGTMATVFDPQNPSLRPWQLLAFSENALLAGVDGAKSIFASFAPWGLGLSAFSTIVSYLLPR